VERLHYLLPKNIPFYVTSATLPPLVLYDVMDILHIRHDNVHTMQRSNDRPNVHLIVQQMVHPAKSFLDLAFLIPDNLPPGWKPPNFLAFFDSITESIAAAKFL
jgi:superfamily II DNA helicase RecQ